MRTYLEDYKNKLISAKAAAKLVRSYTWVHYNHFCAKPIEFDIALGERAGEEGLTNVRVMGLGGIPPAPQVIVKDPQQKSF